MEITGIICEYNPFHKGHAYHLARARELAGADFVVCAMSGSVTQRGVFARHDKWTRARMALACGADLVLELPFPFASGSARRFAEGGVAALAALGADTLAFGSESAELPAIMAAAGRTLEADFSEKEKYFSLSVCESITFNVIAIEIEVNSKSATEFVSLIFSQRLYFLPSFYSFF